MRSLEGLVREALAGVVTGCVALPLCIAAGVLTFASLGPDFAGMAAVAGLVSGIVGGAVAALARRSSFIVTIPTNPTALIQASFLGSLVAAVGDTGLALVILPLTVVAAGLWQVLFGLTGVVRIIRLAPYPVTAGFVSGVGLLIVLSQIPMILGVPSFAALVAGIRPAAGSLIFGLLVIGVIVATGRYLPRVPALPAGLVAAFAAYHIAGLLLPGVDLGPVVGVVDLLSWRPPDLAAASYGIVEADRNVWLMVLAGSLTLALVGTLDTTFAIEAVRNAGSQGVQPKRDLIGQGVASVAAGATGGLFVSTSLSLTTANFRAGGRTRVSALLAALLLLAGVLLIPGVIFALPLVGLAALLVVVGLNVIDRWVFGVCRTAFGRGPLQERIQARRSAVIVIAVAAATVLGEPILGAAVGFGLACLVFLIEMNRPVVQKAETIERLRSKRVRSAAQRGLLDRQGGEVAVVRLQGVLFFGNADEIRGWAENLDRSVRAVILDFRAATDIDVSGGVVLRRVFERLRKEGKLVLISGLREPRAAQALADALPSGSVFTDLDAALEKAEEDMLARIGGEAAAFFEVDLPASDFGRFMKPEDVAVLARDLRPVTFAPGERLCRSGDPSDRLWILSHGSVSAWMMVDGVERRLAGIGPGCTVGEMGLLDGVPRSADVRADTHVRAWELSEEVFRRILAERPSVGHAMLTSIACQLAGRLRQTSEDLRLADS